MKKSMAMTAVALGAAYLLRNKRSRSKLMNQLSNFAGAKKIKNPGLPKTGAGVFYAAGSHS